MICKTQLSTACSNYQSVKYKTNKYPCSLHLQQILTMFYNYGVSEHLESCSCMSLSSVVLVHLCLTFCSNYISFPCFYLYFTFVLILKQAFSIVPRRFHPPKTSPSPLNDLINLPDSVWHFS